MTINFGERAGINIMGNTVNLCDSCAKEYPTCDGKMFLFGDGVGNDNVCCCAAYTPLTVNPWAAKNGGRKLTNREAFLSRIINMSYEDLARLFCKVNECGECDAKRQCNLGAHAVVEWLNKESEGEI